MKNLTVGNMFWLYLKIGISICSTSSSDDICSSPAPPPKYVQFVCSKTHKSNFRSVQAQNQIGFNLYLTFHFILFIPYGLYLSVRWKMQFDLCRSNYILIQIFWWESPLERFFKIEKNRLIYYCITAI